ncbi:MAG: endonuclease/exonuclease/phosphatase family protein, partial [Pirellula sp.]|nr:endonuclease/exonuclease/phosphatase family protein [Pirellula sp.]
RGSRIDWIGCSESWEVRIAQILRNSREGRTPSDHFPVTAVLRPKMESHQGTLRVLSYNIHHGVGTDGKYDLGRIAKILRAWDPDLVALQEVDQETSRSLAMDQAAMLAEWTGLQYQFFKAIDFDSGYYGQVILSRLPMSQAETILLPNEGSKEQRIAGEVVATFGGRSIRFLTTHFDHTDQNLRLRQADVLAKRCMSMDQPVILAGDMNATPDSPVMARLGEVWEVDEGDTEATFPSAKSSKRIDYILVRERDGWSEVGSRSIAEPTASDHHPILRVLRFR